MNRTHRRPPALLLALVLLGALAGSAAGERAARAEEAACEILEVAATTQDPAGGIDAELKPLARKLKKPPFTSWNTFKLLARHAKQLTLLKAESVPLTVGQASVLYRQRSTASGKKDRLELAITVDGKDGKRMLDTKVNIDAGDYFLIGQNAQGNDGLILAFTCRP
jgi:hypothetical protein